jgi:uncharacterized protein
MTGGLEKLITALSDPAVYPHGPDSVQVVHTHISVVFLAGELVYKVKKPLNLGFLDFTTLELRRRFCNQEVLLNSRFSEDIYLGVVSIYEGNSGINLAGQGREIEVAVLMRRIPEHEVMKAMLEKDLVTPSMLDRLARRIASFHAEASSGGAITHFGSPEVIFHNLKENFVQAESFVGRTISGETLDRITSLSLEFVSTNEPLIRKRMREGFIRDCHGDLHLDHVVITNGIVLVDCIEFNDRFRYGDTASDLAFLLMDLDFRGFPAYSDRISSAYAEHSGDRDAPVLLGFYKSYRAFIRGKVLGFELDEEEISSEEKASAKRTATHYFQLALACLAPPQKPVLIAFCGLMGTGKSYLAAKLSKRLGIEHLKSDVLRKEIRGVSPDKHLLDKYGEGFYTSKATDRVYEVLLGKARQALEERRSLILDASFMRYGYRSGARALAEESNARFRIIGCAAPAEVIKHRLDERHLRPGEPSDGRWEIFREQESRFEPIRAGERADYREWDSTSDPDAFLIDLVRDLMGP